MKLDDYIKPKWLHTLTDMVRPGGVALMFLVITILPILFAMLEIGLDGIGVKMASVLASYFKAVPDIYYTTLQVMFSVYVAGKSTEIVSSNLSKKRDVKVQGEHQDVTVNQEASG